MGNYLILIFTILIGFSIQMSYSEEKNQYSPDDYEKLLTNYWNFWINLSEEEESNSKCLMHFDSQNSVVFLLNPYDFPDTTYDCKTTPIPKNSTIFFPILSGWCTNGDPGLRHADILQLAECAYNADRGLIIGKVSVDGNQIVDFQKINDDKKGIVKTKFLDNKTITNIVLDQGPYKELIVKNLVGITITNKTQYDFDNNKEFENQPVTYKGYLHCECIIIDASKLNEGVHTISYYTKANAGDSSIGSGWKYENSITYHLSIK